MTDEFIGLDIEATGADYQPPGMKPNYQRFQLCQIGLASFDDFGEPSWFSAVVGHDKIESEAEAMTVHGITEETILGAARAPEVDSLAVKWMDEQGIRRAIPVGFSVGSFDMPYVRETLPLLARKISMRSMDLNAVVFTVSKIMGRSYKAVKSAAAKYAEKKISETTMVEKRKHDAGYDALLALYSWDWFKQILVVREVHDYL